MTSNTPAAQSFNSLFEQHKTFLDEIAPFRDRLFKFLRENESKHVFTALPAREYSIRGWTHLDSYSIDLRVPAVAPQYGHTTPGVFFSAPDSDEDSFFVLPFEYIENPDAWEAKVLHAMEHYQSLVEDAYYRIAPHQRNNPEVHVHQGHLSERNGTISATVTRSTDGNIVFRKDPNRADLVVNYFEVSLDNGDIVDRQLI